MLLFQVRVKVKVKIKLEIQVKENVKVKEEEKMMIERADPAFLFSSTLLHSGMRFAHINI